MFFLSGKNGFNVCLSLQLISLLKKMYLSYNILIFFKTKSLQNFFTTYERCQVVTRHVSCKFFWGKKCTFQWHTNKIPKFMNRRKRFEIPITKKKTLLGMKGSCTSPLNCCYSPRDMPVHTPGSWQGHSKVGPTTPPGSWPLKKIHHNELYNVTC